MEAIHLRPFNSLIRCMENGLLQLLEPSHSCSTKFLTAQFCSHGPVDQVHLHLADGGRGTIDRVSVSLQDGYHFEGFGVLSCRVWVLVGDSSVAISGLNNERIVVSTDEVIHEHSTLESIAKNHQRSSPSQFVKVNGTYLWWIPSTSHHLLQHHSANLLLGLAHTHRHVGEQRVVTDVRSVAVAKDVGGPLVLGGVGVAGTNVAGLEGLKVLECTEFVGHGDLWVIGDGVGGRIAIKGETELYFARDLQPMRGPHSTAIS